MAKQKKPLPNPVCGKCGNEIDLKALHAADTYTHPCGKVLKRGR